MAEQSGDTPRDPDPSQNRAQTRNDPARAALSVDASGLGEGFDAVILAGGAASRLGGADKPALVVGDRTLLDVAVSACAAARRIVVVGPVRPVEREVAWAREEPAGAGPAAALAAGLSALSLSSLGTDAAPYTIVLAADLPFITTEVIHNLWTTLTRSAHADTADQMDGAVAVDESGRAQWLTACYRRAALLDRIGSFPPERLIGLSLRRLLDGLRLAHVEVSARAAFDCDTWAEVETARGMDGAAQLE